MGDKDAPQAPALPKDLPEGLRKFLACEKDAVTLKDGELTWVSVHGSDLIPADMAPIVPDKILKGTIHPSMTITPDPSGPGKASIKIGIDVPGWGTVGPSVPASIDDGTLSVDTSGLPQSLKDPIESAVKNLNDWFKSKGKGLAAPAFGAGQTGLSKIDLPAPQATTTPPPTPVPGPEAPKPTPPPPPDASPPTPQAAGTDWSHLTPTSAQWDKALAETKADALSGGPKPPVGAGGPGGPKAPAGLATPAIIALVGLVIVALVGGIVWFAGPALGRFGAKPVATTTPTTTATTTTTTITTTTTSTPAPQIVTSDDGLVTLTIPYGVAPAGTTFTVTALGSADAPPELAAINVRSFYRIAPGDVVLDGSATLDRTVDLSALRIDPATAGYPVIPLALRSGAGWSWLGTQQAVIEADDPIGLLAHYPMATLDRTGDVFGFGGQLWAHPDPFGPVVRVPVGTTVPLAISISARDGAPFAPGDLPTLSVTGTDVSTPGVVEVGQPLSSGELGGLPRVDFPVTCRTAGDVALNLFVRLDELPSNSLYDDLDLVSSIPFGITDRWEVSCFVPFESFSPELDSGCDSAIHRPLGSDPSYQHIVVVFSSASTFPPDPTLSLSFREGASGPLLTFPDIPIIDDQATADAGITKYGDKIWGDISVDGSDGSKIDISDQWRQLFGPSVTVTSTQGPLAGNACP